MLDVATVVRAGSRGFTVLLVGELIALAVGLVSGVLGGILFAMSAAAGPITAGTMAAGSDPPIPHGAAAGLLAYGLTVPLRYMTDGPEPTELVFSVVVSTALGALGARTAARVARGTA